MRFATRTFLWSILPFAVLLTGSFWAVQNRVLLKVRERLQSSVKQTQASLASMLSRTEQRDSRVVRAAVSQNSALKAGVQLLLGDRRDPQARLTLEDQLLEIGNELGFDFLQVSDGNGAPLAAVMLQDGSLKALDLSRQQPPRQGYFTSAGRTYQVTSAPIDEGRENLGSLSVGERVDLSMVPGPAVLMRDGKIVETNTAGLPLAEAESSLRSCGEASECEIRLGGETYVSTPIQGEFPVDGYVVRSLENLDAATGPIQAILRRVFLIAGLGALAVAVLVTGFSSRSIVRPISGVIDRLHESAKTGELPLFDGGQERIHEIRDLAESFNRAASSIQDGQERLLRANVEFIESLASALDARDPYTAGHSQRVSQYASMLAQAMGLSAAQTHEIRVGALLHDIGKIGITDSILLKPERLTPEEDRIIRQHPSIGRRILEGVRGFQPFLDVVELHHENWDGTGYPRGLCAEETPLAARVVKIADAWDAMTSDRPYRHGMSRNQALAMLRKVAGTQMDPAITEVFCNMWGSDRPGFEGMAAQDGDALKRLSDAVSEPARVDLPQALEPKDT
ncbi:MAG TPA: HD-GYP domain-containing protein [Bryobacteraceae bacterium]|jgi:putative nucleotidyltransferase with HDIG domain